MIYKIVTEIEISDEQHRSILSYEHFNDYCDYKSCSGCPFENFGSITDCEKAFQKIKEGAL